jgi:DNA repair protein RecO (recombination protein O)
MTGKKNWQVRYFSFKSEALADKLHKTKGLVLRTVKYGDTSIIVTIFTSLFGIQSYLVNGVRSSSKKGAGKANLFQPAAFLDLVVYHNELKQLNRIREFRWAHIYQDIFSDVPKNAVALFMIEMLTKCLKQPEPNEELFSFLEDIFLNLDHGSGTINANLPLFFVIHLSHFFGFRIDDNYSEERPFLDLMEGSFAHESPQHPYFIEGKQASVVADFLKVMQLGELASIRLHGDFRRQLLQVFEKYYALHITDFGSLKSLPVLTEVLN